MFLVLFVGVLLVDILNVEALSCLSCDAVAHPRICSHVTECFKEEQCGMETFINEDGGMVYRLGCFDSNTCGVLGTTTPDNGNQFYSCHQCCNDSDLCNAHGCNSTGFPVDRGPLCYSCGVQFEGTPCHQIEHCETHEVCYNEVTLEFQTDRVVKSGCRSKHSCADQTVDPLVGIGKRTTHPLVGIGKRTTHICSDCCDGDLCNVQCENAGGCSDDDRCALLMSSLDVCQSPDLAKEFCKKTCGLCSSNSGVLTCQDSRLDCVYINKYTTVCTSEALAKSYGCLDFCGFCTGGLTTASYTHTTPTFPTYTHTTPTFSTGSTTAATTTVSNAVFNIGDLVVPGPDWNGGNETGNGTGTVIATHGVDHVMVYWNATGSHMTYIYQTNGSKQIEFLTSSPMTSPTTPSFDSYNLAVGDRVVRGPDWRYGTMDGNGLGTVVKVEPGLVTVHWEATSITNIFSNGFRGKHDVMKVPPPTTTTQTTPPTTSTTPDTPTTTQDMPTTTQDAPTTTQDPPTTTQDTPTTTQDAPTTTQDTPTTTVTQPMPTTTTTLTTTTTRTSTTTTTTTTPPPTAGPVLVNDIYVGASVQRGRDWRYGTQDGNGPGIVIDVDQVKGWVKIQWNTGYTNDYRLGAENKYDIMFVPGTYNPPTSVSPPIV